MGMIFLGNLSISEIESRMGINLDDAKVVELSEMRQEKAEHIAPGKWHGFDLPFMIVCGDKPTAEKVVSIFSKHDLTHVKECLRVSWEAEQ